MNKKTFLGLGLAISLFSAPLSAWATQADFFFNPNFIISNEELEDFRSLSVSTIEQFLTDRGSGLAGRTFTDYAGKSKTAAEIIWQASQESRVNPKVLLATLQKEQSLVGDPSPSQRQLDRAMGYRCPDSGSCHPNTLDFGKQVDGAAWQFRQYLDRANDWNIRAGNTYVLDGFTVSPVNSGTAAFYNYTPHYTGNERFWRIWLDFWGRNFPDGSLVKTGGNPGVWLIQNGFRRLITSNSILQSRFDPKKIISIGQSDLEKYTVGPTIKFYNYSLLRLDTGQIYLLVDDELRYITSPEAFRQLGFNPEELEPVTADDLVGLGRGRDLTAETTFPTGALLQDSARGGVYYIENGIRHPLYSREVMRIVFPRLVAKPASPAELAAYELGEPVKFKDGELVKSFNDSRIFVISDGQRRWIRDEATFAHFGYQWNNIVETSAQAVEAHPMGEELKHSQYGDSIRGLDTASASLDS